MSDIAKEMGVSRPTLYKQVASVEEAISLVAARQLFVLLDELSGLLSHRAGPQTYIDMAVRAVTFARAHPLADRLLNHEPDLVGRAITSGQFATYVDQITALVAPMLRDAMRAGAIKAGDPRLTAELIVRLCGSLLLIPTGTDVEKLVRAALEPVLTAG